MCLGSAWVLCPARGPLPQSQGWSTDPPICLLSHSCHTGSEAEIQPAVSANLKNSRSPQLQLASIKGWHFVLCRVRTCWLWFLSVFQWRNRACSPSESEACYSFQFPELLLSLWQNAWCFGVFNWNHLCSNLLLNEPLQRALIPKTDIQSRGLGGWNS